jgi:hypothetical protein
MQRPLQSFFVVVVIVGGGKTAGNAQRADF